MVDTINLRLNRDSVSSTDLLAEIPCYLSEVTEHYKEDQVFVSGHLNNLRVSINENGISIKGSLPKYFLGDNFQTLMRSDIERAIERLSDELHLPIGESKVSRIDIAQNIVTDYKPEMYYNYLGDCQYYQRLLQPHSLYYSNRSRTKLFYNKIIEGKQKGQKIPPHCLNTQILRYEYRLTKRVAKSLKQSIIEAKNLFDEQFYMLIIDKYVEEFENINKISRINFNLDYMKSPNDFIMQMALLKIQEIGQNETMSIIEEMRSKQVFDKKEYYSRLKRKIRKLCQAPSITESNDLINELEQKIKVVQVNYR